ncbi:MAG: nucleotide exchange factor GrpE, partial [Candidatus Melainabacteria bacterium]|nr:nucleotide exchange factor GrpE [Candidatus Melainabacteria bacterium]
MTGKKEEKKHMEKTEEDSRAKVNDKDISTSSESGNVDKDSNNINEKLKELESQYLRLMADYQNLQKRTVQEKEDWYKFAGQRTIEALMPALDTFDYACNSISPESEKEKLIQDFKLVFESLIKALNEVGLEVIDETGIPFDPFYHEPLQQVHTNELPNHTIMQVLKKGYMLNKKVIRPAMVAVSVNPSGDKEESSSQETM